MGSAFVRYMLQAAPDVQVAVLDSLTYAGDLNRIKDAMDDGIRFIEGDICDRALLDGLVGDFDAVVHFAAETDNDRSIADALPFVRTNVEGTLSVCDACAKHAVRLHHISTDEVFGDTPRESTHKFTEGSPYNPSSPYAATKAASDMIVRSYIRTHGLAATISNSCNNYGPHQGRDRFIPKTIDLVGRGLKPRIYGDGKNVREWLHVDDHASAVWAILDHGRIGERYLVGSGIEKSNLEVADMISTALGRPSGAYDLVDDRAGHDRRYSLDCTKIKSELGWMPVHLDFAAEIDLLASN